MMNNGSATKIGISIGDIAGIGPEVVLKALADKTILESSTPIIYAESNLIQKTAHDLAIQSFQFEVISDSSEAIDGKINIVQVWHEKTVFQVGVPSKLTGECALMSLESAVSDLSSGRIDALVTAPIDKHNIQSDRFKFPGHTEYLAMVAQCKDYLMLLVSGNLRVGVVTGHIPVSRIARVLDTEGILRKLSVIQESLKNDFAIARPKIAVLGLNPHAGDNGLIGKEESELILPAIRSAQDAGFQVDGPFPADGFFGSSRFKQYDAILAMYHDQGLIPFKALSFGSGVNFTAGLPFIRTSPDHGTAFDIAGKGIADESSFREAFVTALETVERRRSGSGKDRIFTPL